MLAFVQHASGVVDEDVHRDFACLQLLGERLEGDRVGHVRHMQVDVLLWLRLL